MELVLKQELEVEPEPIAVTHFTTHGLLNSNYQYVVSQSFSKMTTKSIFGIRQRLKSSQLNRINDTALIMKLLVFAIVLVILF